MLLRMGCFMSEKRYFVSYFRFWHAPRPLFPTPHASQSQWIPDNGIIDIHPLKWAEMHYQEELKLFWWCELHEDE
jgi:hypothetical protein